MLALVSCAGDQPSPSQSPQRGSLTEVSPPTSIQRLSRLLERYEPHLEVISPRPDQVVSATTVPVKLAVQGLPIARDPEFGMGSHVHVVLDREDPRHVYDLSQPLVLEGLSPGTHTLRAFVVSPWQESFKNGEAYSAVTFHVLTETKENTPNPQQPLLTYNQPEGTYGAEPILLDFYLHNAPLHQADMAPNSPTDWQVQVTVNGDRFVLDQWQAVYLKGFHPGENWVKLELCDRNGYVLGNPFNSTAHLVTYQPNGTDTQSRLLRGEVIAGIEKIIDSQLVPTAASPEPVPSPTLEAPPLSPTPSADALLPAELSAKSPAQPQAEPATETASPPQAESLILPLIQAPAQPKKLSPEPTQETAPAPSPLPPVVAPAETPIPTAEASNPVPEQPKRKPRIPLKPRVTATPQPLEIPAELTAPADTSPTP
jgi:hypothetical protein